MDVAPLGGTHTRARGRLLPAVCQEPSAGPRWQDVLSVDKPKT